MAYFYCQQQDGRRSPEDVLCSFVKQLALQEESALAILRARYKQEERGGHMSSQLSVKDSGGLLKEMATHISKTLLILDALDECGKDTDERLHLLSTFSVLLESDLPVKIIVSSRHDGAIDHWKRKLKCKTVNVNIEATDNEDDIREFVSNRIVKFKDQNDSEPRAMRPDVEREIVETFQQKSDGMYVICT